MNALVNTSLTAHSNAEQSQYVVDLTKSIVRVVYLTATKYLTDNEDCGGRLIYAATQLRDIEYATGLITEIQHSANHEHIDNAITVLYLMADAFQCDMAVELILPMFKHLDELLDSVTFTMNMSGVTA